MPEIRQSNSYSCGAACLLSVLGYYDKFDGNEDELADQLNTTSKDGTKPENIVKVARKYGLNAYIKENCSIQDLRNFFKKRIPVIIDYQAWTEKEKVDWEEDETDGHYSVLIGIDEKNIYFNDPSILGKKGFLPISEFLERWHDEGYERMCIVITGTGHKDKNKIIKIQ